MSLKSKMEYLKAVYHRYRKAGKQEKGRILKEFCKVCGYNRKYAIGLLSAPYPDPKTRAPRKRSFRYSRRALSILEDIWKTSGYLCSQRLKRALPLWLPAARKRFALTPEIEKELISISPRQIDNRLKDKKRALKKKIYGTTKPGSLLKSMIPIKTDHWDIKLPGFLELDHVAHCGNSNEGVYVNTLNATDIQTGWTERAAVMGKGAAPNLDALMDIKKALPFRLRGIDSDSGEEFINYHFLNFCLKSSPKIEFTRSRPNKKNDNAHVEQKNWTHVRQIFGWDRYDAEEARAAMNDLYENELRLFQNLFQPSMKLREKTRVGSKTRRRYDEPKTPFQRLLESGKYHGGKVKRLRELMKTLDPFELSRGIDQKLQAIGQLASQRIRAPRASSAGHNDQPAAPLRSPAPWMAWGFSRKSAKRNKIMRKKLLELSLRSS